MYITCSLIQLFYHAYTANDYQLAPDVCLIFLTTHKDNSLTESKGQVTVQPEQLSSHMEITYLWISIGEQMLLITVGLNYSSMC